MLPLIGSWKIARIRLSCLWLMARAGSSDGSRIPHSARDAGRTAPRDASGALHRDRRLDRRMRVVILEREVLVAEGVEVAHLRIEPHPRERPRRARELEPHLLEVVDVDVRVAKGVDELAAAQPDDLR